MGTAVESAKSGNREGLLLLGEYYYRTAAYHDAEKQLSTYLAAVPDSTEALYILGKTFFMEGDRTMARNLLLRARQAGDDSEELLHAINCLELKDKCHSLEMASSKIKE